MDGDLCLVDLCLLFFFLHYANVSHVLNLSISESNRANSHLARRGWAVTN